MEKSFEANAAPDPTSGTMNDTKNDENHDSISTAPTDAPTVLEVAEMVPYNVPIKALFDVQPDKEGSIVTPPPSLRQNDEDLGSEDERVAIKTTNRDNCSCYPVIQCWNNAMGGLRCGIIKSMLVLTNHAATRPYTYVIGITLLSLALMSIGLATNFDMSADAVESYTPKNSIINEQRDWIDNQSGFPPPPLSIRALIHSEGETVLSLEGVEKAFQVVHQVLNTPQYDALCSEASLDSKDSYKTAGYVGGFFSECRIRGITMLWNNSYAIMKEEAQSDLDIMLAVKAQKYPDGSDVDTREIMGQSIIHTSKIITAESLLMEVMIPAKHADSLAIQEEVLNQLLNLRKEWSKASSKFKLEAFTGEALEAETTRAVMIDLPLVAVVFVVMVLFTCAVFSSNVRDHATKSSSSHVLLGLGAVICIALSLASSYGLLWIIGVPFSNLTQILPFVMFGIGLDDSFIIFGEYCRTDPKKDSVQRVHDTFEEVALSIAVTKLTTVTAFALAGISNIPALTWLSLYAFPTVLIDAIYKVTFFVALLVLDERRIEANRIDCFVCCVKPANGNGTDVSSEDDATGASLSPFRDPEESAPSEFHADHKNLKMVPKQGKSKTDHVMRWYSDQLLRPSAKMFVGVTFLSMAIGLCYSASLFRQAFDINEMLPGVSFARDYMLAMENHAERGWLIPMAYFRGVNQSDPNVQQEMEHYINDLVAMHSMTEQPPFFWLRHFHEFLTYDDRLLDLTFHQQLDIFLSIGHFKTLYGDHIIRNPETGDIVASRCLLFMDNVDMNSVKSQTAARWELVDVNDAQTVNQHAAKEGEPLKFFLAEPSMLYIWEFYEKTVSELVGTTIVGVVSVGVLGFIFVPHWTATLYLFPIISLLQVELIGFLKMVQVHLNVVSYFALIMSIGLLVDFNMHILMRYYESPGLTRNEKVKDALQTMGSSVLMGGLSTLLGVVPLFFSSSELMKTLGYGFVGMVLLGCSHGLIALPVILSVTGPIKTRGSKQVSLRRMSHVPAVSSSSKEGSITGSIESSSVEDEIEHKIGSSSPEEETHPRNEYMTDSFASSDSPPVGTDHLGGGTTCHQSSEATVTGLFSSSFISSESMERESEQMPSSLGIVNMCKATTESPDENLKNSFGFSNQSTEEETETKIAFVGSRDPLGATPCSQSTGSSRSGYLDISFTPTESNGDDTEPVCPSLLTDESTNYATCFAHDTKSMHLPPLDEDGNETCLTKVASTLPPDSEDLLERIVAANLNALPSNCKDLQTSTAIDQSVDSTRNPFLVTSVNSRASNEDEGESRSCSLEQENPSDPAEAECTATFSVDKPDSEKKRDASLSAQEGNETQQV